MLVINWLLNKVATEITLFDGILVLCALLIKSTSFFNLPFPAHPILFELFSGNFVINFFLKF